MGIADLIFKSDNEKDAFFSLNKGEIKTLALILILSLTSCVVPRYIDVGYYEREWGRCPENASVQHWRAVGKGFNPKLCNFIN